MTSSDPPPTDPPEPEDGAFRRFGREVSAALWPLLKVMIPVALAVRLLRPTGAIELLGEALGPAMGVVGLPAAMGLVWATGLVTNIYGALAVYAVLGPAADLDTAQVTVLGVMVLVAHGLPVECAIARQAGLRWWYSLVLRIVGAMAMGAILHLVYAGTGWLAGPAPVPELLQVRVDTSWTGWALEQLRQIAVVVAAVVALLLLLKLLRLLRIDRALALLLRPVLRLVGIERDALTLTLIGGLLGLSYGGALLIAEARSGRIPPRQVLLAMSFISLCHSLIEDTLLLAVIGAHWSGILVTRAGLSLLAVAILARCTWRWPRMVLPYLMRPVAATSEAKENSHATTGY